MFLFENNVLPDLFKEMFSLRSQIHSYIIQETQTHFTLSPVEPTLGNWRFVFRNLLYSDIKNAESISLYKAKLKAFF